MYSVIVRNGPDEFGFLAREDTCDEGVLREVIEADVYNLRSLNLGETPIIVDVGGHIGAFTRFAAGLWPNGRFYCFEANPRNHSLIGQNLSSITSDYRLYKAALVGEIPVNRRLVIKESEADSITGGWGIIWGDTAFTPGPGVASEVIPAFVKVRDLFDEIDGRINLLKFDCEGSEFSILSSMTDEDLKRVDHIVAEIHVGATAHTPIGYAEFRERILKYFDCPALEGRVNPPAEALFEIHATRREI